MQKLTVFFLFFILCFSSFSQIGGDNTFNFVNLNTSPRAIALGGYLHSVIDADVNNGVYNPALINSSMLDNLSLNYTNYYADIFYGDASYCFGLAGQNFITSVKFIDYGQFQETNSLGDYIGSFTAGEYMLSLGSSKLIDSLFHVGLNTKIAYSSMYDLNSVALFVDFGVTYAHDNRDLTASFIVKNLGYQVTQYYDGNRESLPFEISVGVSNKLAHMPLRWHFTLQHIETPNLSIDNPSLTYVNNDNVIAHILRHVVLGAEFIVHKNVSLLFGYNNKTRYEMIIEDRKGLVGFSTGLSVQIKRFSFYYSRNSHHLSGPINTFGLITNLKK